MAKDGQSPNSLLNDSGNFWQQESPGPFGSLIELAFKLKNAQFRLLQKFGDKPDRYTESSCLIFQSSTGVYRKYKDRQHGMGSQGHLLSKSRSTLQDLSDNYAVDSSCNASSAFKLPLLPELPNKPLKPGMHYENVSEKKTLPRQRKSKSFYAAPRHASTMELLSKHSPGSPTRKSQRLQRCHEDPKRRYNCQLCLYQTDSRFHLRRHQSSVHDADKAYYCYICKKEFSRSERLKSHFLNIHPEEAFHSKMARKDTFMSDDDENDLDMEVGEVRVSCDGNPIVQAAAFEAMQSAIDANDSTAKKSWERYCHVARQPLVNQEIFSCRLCCFSGGDIWLMKKHYLDVHLGVTAYICRICRYSSSCVTRLISHMLGHGELICYYCSYSTTEVKLFEKHLKDCSQLVRCSLCAMSFVDKDQLQSHTIEVHQLVLFCCDQCSFSSNSYAELSIHEGMHAISNPSLVQEIESDDEMLLGPYRSRSEISNASLPNRLLKQQLQSNAGTSADDAVMITNDGDDVVADTTPNPSGSETKDVSVAGTTIPLSSRIYECLVPNCGFKAFWKKSLELHTENYHSISFDHFRGDRSLASCDGWSPAVINCPSSGFFPCPFCPNYRTFKYRKSFEKHLGQHGLDHKKYPYLLSGLNRKGEFLNSVVIGNQ